MKARPICLLDEIGKTFERVIASRLNRWMDENPPFSLSENQFGFRRQRSTIDALLQVGRITRKVVNRNGFVVVVGLDVCNAFNSIPFDKILSAMRDKEFPLYLRRIVADYLSKRYITYVNNGGTEVRKVRAGVPQGSVLGPLLWNIAFDSVLNVHKEDGCFLMCYADDTLIIATSDRLFNAVVKANVMIVRVIRCISELGLKVAKEKTDAMVFSRKLPDRMPRVRAGNTLIPTKAWMKYLGVLMDSSWKFDKHFEYVGAKVAKVSRALCRLMPNLRGPRENKRRLYAYVVTSMAMYAAPVWTEALLASRDKIVTLA